MESVESEYQKISRRIQALRTAGKLSLNELARRTGIDLATISKIVNGKAEPALRNLFKISAVLGCSVRDLLEDRTEEEIHQSPPPSRYENLELEYQKIGQRIRSIREEKAISQTDLARLAGMHPLSLQKIERGAQHPPLRRLFQLSKVLGCSVSDLFEDPTKENYNNLEAEYKKLGERIRAIHASKNTTRWELAQTLGVDMDTLAKIEDGRKVPTLENLYQIRGILGCSMRDFFDESPIKSNGDLRVEDVVQAMRYVKKIRRIGMRTE